MACSRSWPFTSRACFPTCDTLPWLALVITSPIMPLPCVSMRSLGLLVRKIGEPRAEDLVRALSDKVR